MSEKSKPVLPPLWDETKLGMINSHPATNEDELIQRAEAKSEQRKKEISETLGYIIEKHGA